MADIHYQRDGEYPINSLLFRSHVDNIPLVMPVLLNTFKLSQDKFDVFGWVALGRC